MMFVNISCLILQILIYICRLSHGISAKKLGVIYIAVGGSHSFFLLKKPNRTWFCS